MDNKLFAALKSYVDSHGGGGGSEFQGSIQIQDLTDPDVKVWYSATGVNTNSRTFTLTSSYSTSHEVTSISLTLDNDAGKVALSSRYHSSDPSPVKITGVATPTDDDDAANKSYVDGKIVTEIPSISIPLAYINAVSTTLLTKVMTSAATSVCTSMDTSTGDVDNTLHTRLVQCRNANNNVLTEVKVGDTNRTMLFKYENTELFSCDGFWVTEGTAYVTFKLIVEWNRISIFATKHTYAA